MTYFKSAKTPYWREVIDSLDVTGPIEMVTIKAGCAPGKTMMHVVINSDGGYISDSVRLENKIRLRWLELVNKCIAHQLPRKKKKAFKKLRGL